ncbi:coiled-coil domain-containing protein 103 [Lampris incognitus]|uniref:coiled-coil domain-containing protein 103 n=1 Tax=Lampris incognitus TaxID=2546036 RepID=UPI0024B49CF1|nr:coiled-coil domain-containing protein 103 [Lampris incognitus]
MDAREGELINFSALERELCAAVEADQRYQRENDAKLRAINQKVGSYEEFRDIVLSCHLKPLERKDKEGAARKQPWNPLVSSSKAHNSLLSHSNTQHPVVSLATEYPASHPLASQSFQGSPPSGIEH